jgi:hypothetical protein
MILAWGNQIGGILKLHSSNKLFSCDGRESCIFNYAVIARNEAISWDRLICLVNDLHNEIATLSLAMTRCDIGAVKILATEDKQKSDGEFCLIFFVTLV